MQHWNRAAIDQLKRELGGAADLVAREIPSAGTTVLFLESLVDPQRAEDRLIGRLLAAQAPRGGAADWLRDTVAAARIAAVDSTAQAARALVDGDAIVVLHKTNAAYRVSTEGTEHRQPEAPDIEVAIRGPKDGFTESLSVNLGLVRGRVRDPALRVEEYRIGVRSRTRVALLYHADLTNLPILCKVRRRLRQIHTDRITESGQLEQWLEDSPHSLYPQIHPTERPDRVAAALFEGRLALLVEGDPFSLILPAVMVSFFQAPDDYSHRWIFGSLLRWVRLVALAASLVVPSLYVAMTMFNPEQMPLKIALTLAASREGIPFSIVVEALVMESMVELIREAGTRMPRPLGQPMAIVGGLVIGELAVRAQLVSATMVVLVGLTSIGSFAIPSYEAALTTRMLRFPLVILTGAFGIAGTIFFVSLILAHLCTLRSLGIPYLTPFSQLAYRDWKDTLIRSPVGFIRRRPESYGTPDLRRAGRRPR